MTAGHDHTCRVWKVPEESQLIFRARAPALDAVRYVTGTEWLSGGADGALALWRRAPRLQLPRMVLDVPGGVFAGRPAVRAVGAWRRLEPEVGWPEPRARRLPQCVLAARSLRGYADWYVRAASRCQEWHAVVIMLALARMRCCRSLPWHLAAGHGRGRPVRVMQCGPQSSSEPMPGLLGPPYRRRRVRLSTSRRPQRAAWGRAAAK